MKFYLYSDPFNQKLLTMFFLMAGFEPFFIYFENFLMVGFLFFF